MFLSDDKEYVPLEFISPYSRAERYLSEMEENFSEENAFMKDFFV